MNIRIKFVHRKCIKRWCNKKGNITCEICNKVHSPNMSSLQPNVVQMKWAWTLVPRFPIATPMLVLWFLPFGYPLESTNE